MRKCRSVASIAALIVVTGACRPVRTGWQLRAKTPRTLYHKEDEVPLRINLDASKGIAAKPSGDDRVVCAVVISRPDGTDVYVGRNGMVVPVKREGGRLLTDAEVQALFTPYVHGESRTLRLTSFYTGPGKYRVAVTLTYYRGGGLAPEAIKAPPYILTVED